MNRQIKFRGKSLKSGEWFYGSLAYFPDSQTAHIIPCGTCKGEEVICNFVEVNPYTVGQFTGLLDRNGKEIYEGDILAYKWMDGDIADVDYYSVHFIEGAFCLKGEYGHSPLYEQDMRKYEVVGNIHEQSKS